LTLMLLPIAALTIAQSSPLVYMIYSHTQMRGPDLDATAEALVLFSLGMFAWGAQNILARGFYAARDTLTPAWIGTALTFLNLPVYWILVRHFQYGGLALASSCGIVVYTLVLFVLLNRRTHNPDVRKLVSFFFKLAIASTVAAIAAFEVVVWLKGHIAWRSAHGAFLVLVIASSVGFTLTAALAKLLGVSELDRYLNRLSRASDRG